MNFARHAAKENRVLSSREVEVYVENRSLSALSIMRDNFESNDIFDTAFSSE